jgi:hypothetical protein
MGECGGTVERKVRRMWWWWRRRNGGGVEVCVFRGCVVWRKWEIHG